MQTIVNQLDKILELLRAILHMQNVICNKLDKEHNDDLPF